MRMFMVMRACGACTTPRGTAVGDVVGVWMPHTAEYIIANMGIFMAGAYQETLGDIHNLFGDTDSVDVVLGEDGFSLRNARPGDTADSLLKLVGFQPRQLLAACRAKVTAAGLEREEAEAIERLLAEGLSAYTYLAGD